MTFPPVPSRQVVAPSPSSAWLSVNEFASIADIGDRRARRAMARAVEGLTWNGCMLTVQATVGKGGKAGEQYQVLASSLPRPLYEKWVNAHCDVLAVAPYVTLPETSVTHDPIAAKRSDKALWILSVIRPIIGLEKNSSERAVAFADVLKRSHVRPDGKVVSVSKTQLYDWLKRYETEGVEGVKPRQRTDLGQRRVHVTMKWDATCPLGAAAKQAVAEELEGYVMSMWAAGASGWRDIQQMASQTLQSLSKAAGWNAPDTELKSACSLSRTFIEAGRKSGLLAVKDKDAKQYFDKNIPRITRGRAGMKPMDVVVGDVHPIDIAHTREDGSIVYAKAICWLDMATNRMFVHLVYCEPGKGITQLHIGQAFATMCASWGLPRTLYLDNGSEYSWHEMMVAFAELSRLTQAMERKFALMELPESGEVRELLNEQRSIIRAKPYNAPAKPIEGIFSVIEGTAFSMIPGWTGGDRMRAKTHNVGSAPLAYPGTRNELSESIGTAVDFYHQKTQRGSLNGESPNSAYHRHIAAGWKRTDVSERVMLLAFADEDTRKVNRGCLSWQGTTYYDDALLPHTGETLTVRVCRHDPRYAFVFNKKRDLICAAEVEKIYDFMDPEGAKEQARRNKKQNQYVASLRKSVHYIDLVQEMEKAVLANPTMAQAQIGATVAMSESAKQMVDAMHAKEEIALEESKKAATGGRPKQLSQWSSPDESDPYLDAVGFADEEPAS